jgi:hypothetical protein
MTTGIQSNSAFRLERNGFKKGYALSDMNGKHPIDDALTGGGVGKDMPNEFSTNLNVDSVFDRITLELDVSITCAISPSCKTKYVSTQRLSARITLSDTCAATSTGDR